MAASKKRPAMVIDATPADVLDASAVEVIASRDHLLELAAQWEHEAAQLDAQEPQGSGNAVLDFIGGLTFGAADESRAQTLRRCARELRLAVGRG